MGEMFTAHILKDLDDSVVIHIVMDSSPKNHIIKKHLINFRNKPAPKNLLIKDTILKVKLLNKIPQYAEIDPNLELNAIFGYIKYLSDEEKIVTIDTYGYEQIIIQYQELLGPDDKVLKQGTHQSYIYQPVVIYFEKENVIEAKIITESINNLYKIQKFHKNELSLKNSDFLILKDDRLIPHKIYKNRVFYMNGVESFREFEVEELIGTEVKVVIENKKIKALVQKDMHDKASNNDSLYKPLKLIPTEQDHLLLNSECKKSKRLDRKYNTHKPLYLEEISPEPLEVKSANKNCLVSYGKRKRINEKYFIKKYNESNDELIMLLGLLEVGYRFSDWQMKKSLEQEITQNVKIEEKELEKLNLLLNTVINTELGNIERFYSLLNENFQLLQNISKSLFKSPLNLNLISDKYNIYIFVTNKTLKQWKTYKPFNVDDRIPYIYLCNEPQFGIIYDLNMMLYDGYTPSGDEYIVQQDLNPDTIKYKSGNDLNYQNLFNSIKKLQEKLPKSDKDSINLYFEIVNSLNTIIPSNMILDYSNLYKELLNFSYDPEGSELKCLCGTKANKNYKCNDHYLCDGCAFISWRLRLCLTCSACYIIKTNHKQISCSVCKSSYNSKDFFGFRCRCILCSKCLNHLLSHNCRICYKSHELDDYSLRLSIYFLRGLGYSLNP